LGILDLKLKRSNLAMGRAMIHYAAKSVFDLAGNGGTQNSTITSLAILAPKNEDPKTKLRITSMATASALYGKSAIT
jgi:hypothetical protein